MTRRQNLHFHIESNDYFGTLATILNLIQEPIGTRDLGRNDQKILRHLVDDLVYLQKNYTIKKRSHLHTSRTHRKRRNGK